MINPKDKLQLLLKSLFLFVVVVAAIRLTHEILYTIYGNDHYHIFPM
jgi:hypothetical protein